jgi:TRAP-type C4-dicarboxylate transport system permease small subunit
MTKAIRYLGIVMEWLTFACFTAFVISTLAQIIFRYLLLVSVPWTEELARYLCVWTTFMGAAVAVEKGSHIKIIFVQEKLPGFIRFRLLILINFLMIIFSMALLKGVIVMMENTWNMYASTMPLRMTYVYLALFISCIVIIINLCNSTYRMLKKGSSEKMTYQELDF